MNSVSILFRLVVLRVSGRAELRKDVATRLSDALNMIEKSKLDQSGVDGDFPNRRKVFQPSVHVFGQIDEVDAIFALNVVDGQSGEFFATGPGIRGKDRNPIESIFDNCVAGEISTLLRTASGPNCVSEQLLQLG